MYGRERRRVQRNKLVFLISIYNEECGLMLVVLQLVSFYFLLSSNFQRLESIDGGEESAEQGTRP